MGECIASDVAVIGGSVAGLWSAKELIDQGYSVSVAEKSPTLADGATTRNEGWLHAGTYHSIGIENPGEVVPVTSAIQWSHQEVLRFAPEAIDHTTSFAVAASEVMAHKAVTRWDQTGVGYTELSPQALGGKNGVDVGRLSAVFKVDDVSINTRALCQKLARYITDNGGRIFTNTQFAPESSTTATLDIDGNRKLLCASRFLITAGNGLKDIVEEITGKELAARFFKAHLLVVPRLTEDNIFHLEAGESGYMNHGKASVVAVNRDGIESPEPNYDIAYEKIVLAYEALARLVPSFRRYSLLSPEIGIVVCNKPDISGDFGGTQSLDIKVFEPAANYICALPGKMTMAPYLASKIVDMLTRDRLKPALSSVRPNVEPPSEVTLRPVDQWSRSGRSNH